jgi:uncharacterized YccA/Bax inhibitor family protein
MIILRASPLFSNIETGSATYDVTDKASYKGIAIKTTLLFLLTIASAVATILFVPRLVTNDQSLTVFLGGLIVAAILALVSAIVGRLSYRLAMPFSIIYSLSMGLLLGFVSALAEIALPGIAMTAVFATLIIFAIMLLLFFTGVIKAGNKLMAVMLGLLLGGISITLFTFIMLWTNQITTTQYLWLLLLIEAIYLLYAVIMLTFNFSEAAYVVKFGAAKSAEWSVALGLMSSLAYIYIELLRILLIVASLVGNRN